MLRWSFNSHMPYPSKPLEPLVSVPNLLTWLKDENRQIKMIDINIAANVIRPTTLRFHGSPAHRTIHDNNSLSTGIEAASRYLLFNLHFIVYFTGADQLQSTSCELCRSRRYRISLMIWLLMKMPKGSGDGKLL